jgi:hypothetical protein
MTRKRSLAGPATLRRFITLGLLVPAAVCLSATAAQASGETISIVQNDPSAVVGRATNFTASGALNPDDTMFGFDIYVFLKDADADPTCAADFDTESANALHSGGNESWVAPSGGFQVGMGPSYSQPFKITFTGGGHYLLCGYVQGDFSTFAAGELRGTVADATGGGGGGGTGGGGTGGGGGTAGGGGTPGGGGTAGGGGTGGNSLPPVSKPVVMVHPWVTRRGHTLTCHPGTWGNQPTSRSYRWFVKGHRATVGTQRKLKAVRPLRGRKVLCRVTAANVAGRTTVASRAVRAR